MNLTISEYKSDSAVCLPGLKRLNYTSRLDGLRDWGTLLPGKNPALWIVVLHGHGAQGDQLYTRADIRQIWLPEFLAAGLNWVLSRL